MTYDICIAVGPYNKLGGIERYNVELVRVLAAAGHRVTIIATEVGYPVDNIVDVITVRANAFVPALAFLLKAAKTSRHYFKFKKEHPEGLFIVNGLPSFFSDFMIAQSVHRQAVIVTNAREPKTATGYARRVLRKLRPLNLAIIFFEWFSVKFGSARVIAIAQKVKREIVALYGVPDGKVIVVYSGVNAQEFVADPQTRERVRTAAGLAADDFLFLFSGNEFKRKGLAYVLAALAEIKDPKAKLIVAGRAKDGAFKELAKKCGVDERVFFIGPRSDFADWCAACDAFVFPTLDEPFGLVIVEALAAGLPVITSGPHYAGASERMTSGVDSLLLDDPTDVGHMVADMRKVLEDGAFRAMLAKNGRKTAEGLSWEEVAGGIVGAWETYRDRPAK